MNPTEALASVGLFASLDAGTREALAGAMESRDLGAGDVLVRHGEVGDAMFVIVTGRFRVEIVQPDHTTLLLAHLGPGQTVGEIDLFAGGRRSATVTCDEPARVFRLPRAALDALDAPQRASLTSLMATVRERTLHTEFTRLLTAVVGPLDADAIRELQTRITWVRLPRGEALFRQGDPGDAWYIVARGRLQVVLSDRHGDERVLRELGRGESLGEIAMLTDEPRSATPYAMRDSLLLRIGKADFDAIMVKYPRALMSIAKTLIARSIKAKDPTPPRVNVNLAVVGVGPAPLATWFCQQLVRACEPLGSTSHVSTAIAAELGVLSDARRVSADDDIAWLRFSEWFEAQDDLRDILVIEADADAPEWTRRVIRQADRVLLVADATAAPTPGALETALAASFVRGAHVSLVLVHPEGTAVPSGTGRWLSARPWLSGHHHVLRGRAADVQRIARIVCGRAIGLALGGGGARGFAHLGVLRAMEELGIPVDLIGGTSMGSIMAGQYAMGLSIEAALDLNRRIAETRPFTEYTLPLISLVRSRRVDNSARMSFADVCIEDLWIPYFCVSTNLSTAELHVHDQGPLWQATRASGSLPGILAPVVVGRALLVDGGVVNNLPGDILRERCGGGVVIAVDVGAETDVVVPGRVPSPWRVLAGRALPFVRVSNAPTITDVLMRSMMVGSAARAAAVRREVDVCLRPDVQAFGTLAFDDMHAIYDAGRQCALAELPARKAEWDARR